MKDPVDREWFSKAFELYATHRLVRRWSNKEGHNRPYINLSAEMWRNYNYPCFAPSCFPEDWDIWKGPMK